MSVGATKSMLTHRSGLLGAIAGLLVSAAAAERPAPNMNGEYIYWKTPGAPAAKSFPTNLMSYPGGVESFDAYHGPITSTYSQVWWTTSTDALPQHIIERFAGKVNNHSPDSYSKNDWVQGDGHCWH